MRLTKLTVQDASTLAVATLRLDADAIGLLSSEGLANSQRRAASFMCPTSPAHLVDAVLAALKPLHGDELRREDLVDLLDQLVASGDLLELRHEGYRSTRLLYLAPPSYVERVPGVYLLMGVRPFGAAFVDEDLAGVIEYEGHTRVLRIDSGGAESRLRSQGLQKIPKDRWVATPSAESPTELIARHSVRLETAPDAGQLDGLTLLDPTLEVGYYRGRWRSPDVSDSGDFIARRPQAYGADLWCLVRIQAGKPLQILDFPIDSSVILGRDEAWRYQAAVDAKRGRPQQFVLRPCASSNGEVIIDFFSPLPGFAERYMQYTGLALGKTPRALFSFRLPAEAADDVTTFLTDMLWMTHKEDRSGK